jgi:hypothetical protein
MMPCNTGPPADGNRQKRGSAAETHRVGRHYLLRGLCNQQGSHPEAEMKWFQELLHGFGEGSPCNSM